MEAFQGIARIRYDLVFEYFDRRFMRKCFGKIVCAGNKQGDARRGMR